MKQSGNLGGIHLYAGDNSDTLPSIAITNGMPFSLQWRFFKELAKGYDGLNGASSPQDKLFACPADTFYYSNNLINNSMNMGVFVDNHVKYIPFYCDSTQTLSPCFYNPPPSYDYQWGE